MKEFIPDSEEDPPEYKPVRTPGIQYSRQPLPAKKRSPIACNVLFILLLIASIAMITVSSIKLPGIREDYIISQMAQRRIELVNQYAPFTEQCTCHVENPYIVSVCPSGTYQNGPEPGDWTHEQPCTRYNSSVTPGTFDDMINAMVADEEDWMRFITSWAGLTSTGDLYVSVFTFGILFAVASILYGIVTCCGTSHASECLLICCGIADPSQ